MKTTILRVTVIASLLPALSACATQRPVLASNAQLVRVGSSVADQDIDDCIARAEAAATEGRETAKESVVADAATNSVVGAAAGGAGGAVVGHAGQGAAAGAVGGAVASLTRALLQGLFRSKPPEPAHRQIVDRCLRDKGYEPAGWK